VSAPDEEAPRTYVEVLGRYLRCRQTGRLRDLADARALQRAVEDAVEGTDVRLALYDNRETLPVSEAVVREMWRWHTRGRFRRVAMLFRSVDLRRLVNHRVAASGVLVRSFNDEERALAWLCADDWIGVEALVFELG